MKRNKFFMLGIVTVLVAVLSLTFVSNTFAKYTSTVTGNDTARVAKWAWEIDDVALAKGATGVTVDLFETIIDTKTGAEETDVKSELIAPGTTGSFSLKFDNLSEVNATYAVDFTLTNTANVPIEFSLSGDPGSWETDLNKLDIPATAIAMVNGTATVTVYWQWDFDGDDTSIGFDAQSGVEVTVQAAVTFDQVD